MSGQLPDNVHAAKLKAEELADALIEHIKKAEAEIKELIQHHNQLAIQRHLTTDHGKRPGYLGVGRLFSQAAKRNGIPQEMGKALADMSFYTNPSPKAPKRPRKSPGRLWAPIPKEDRLIEERGQLLQNTRRADTWLLRVYAGIFQGKRDQRNSVVYGSQLEAERALTEFLASVPSSPRTNLGALTFAEYAREHYIPDAESKLSPKTLKLYMYDIENRLIPNIGERRLQNITKRSLARLEQLLAKNGSAPRVAKMTVSTARRILRHAVERGLKAPALLFHEPKRRKE